MCYVKHIWKCVCTSQCRRSASSRWDLSADERRRRQWHFIIFSSPSALPLPLDRRGRVLLWGRLRGHRATARLDLRAARRLTKFVHFGFVEAMRRALILIQKTDNTKNSLIEKCPIDTKTHVMNKKKIHFYTLKDSTHENPWCCHLKAGLSRFCWAAMISASGPPSATKRASFSATFLVLSSTEEETLSSLSELAPTHTNKPPLWEQLQGAGGGKRKVIFAHQTLTVIQS